MSFVTPKYSKSQVNKAGGILVLPEAFTAGEQEWAGLVLANWRAAHGYPINTFQATLRHKLKNGYGRTIVAQRLKRAPSIISKLKRFSGMQLARMQDIGGLRAVVSSVARVRRLEEEYRNTSFEHTLTSSKNYIDDPIRSPAWNKRTSITRPSKNSRETAKRLKPSSYQPVPSMPFERPTRTTSSTPKCSSGKFRKSLTR